MSLLTKKAREKADPARYEIKKFILKAASEIPPGALVLDAGAGNLRYMPFFNRQRYIAADFCKVTDKNYKRMDLVTDLTSMGLKDGSVDAIINIQVLEHVPEPLSLIKEFSRVLKPGGTLYLTCPQGWGVHEAPYDFYRFTCYALDDMFRHAGMEVRSIIPMGGYFSLLGKLVSRLPYQLDAPEKGPIRKLAHSASRVVLKEIFSYWAPYVLTHLDFIDKKKDFTIGYLCTATRPAA